MALLFWRDARSIYSCSRCGLEFSYPQPSDERLAEIYSDAYFLGERSEEALAHRGYLKRATAKLYLEEIVRYVSGREARLLEIGCGSGEFLLEAQARGFKVEGLEYSEHAARNANARLGFPAVRVGSPEADCLPKATYDVIGGFDVIEHLRDPGEALKLLRAALKPGGLLVLVTPSLDSWSRHLLGRRWMEYKTEHLTYFSRKSISRLLEGTGFKVLKFVPNYKMLSLDYIAAHFERFPVPIFSPAMQALRGTAPRKLAHRPFRIVASGLMVLGEKQGALPGE